MCILFSSRSIYINRRFFSVQEEKKKVQAKGERKLIGEKFLIRFSFWHRTLHISPFLFLQSRRSQLHRSLNSKKSIKLLRLLTAKLCNETYFLFSSFMFVMFELNSRALTWTLMCVWYTNIIDYEFNPTRKNDFFPSFQPFCPYERVESSHAVHREENCRGLV